RLEGIYRQLLAGSKVEIVEGWARLDAEAPNTVRIGDRRVTARHIVIATGGRPVGDSIPGIECCATSDDLLDLASLPATAGVIGGGYIAVEFASMLARLGAKVTLFFRDVLPLRGFDTMLRTAAMTSLQAAGIEVRPGSVPQRIQRCADDRLLLHFGAD